MNRIWTVLLLTSFAASLALGACGRSGTPGVRSIDIAVLDQTLYGYSGDKLIKVTQGEKVTIRITTDEPMEVLLHHYDVEVDVKPGEPGTLQFTADTAGRFPLMIHALGDAGGSRRRVEILLGFVDVLPSK